MLIALGSGILIGAVLMNLSGIMSVNGKIEEKARDLGMVYPEEIRVNLEEENK
ncbi:hypothetical protein [Proteiniclasticum sp.]|uniref:hypothetical protein n=1 Tax=Proteiniclasticum sp. TaxID=2053595 RepID=UPI0028A07230|nr:hypothetical protein [Proteiniclasticum sp.]